MPRTTPAPTPEVTPDATPTPTGSITPAQFALAAGTDAKTARRFLRSLIAADARPGKGGRWAIDASLLPDLVERFNARGAKRTATVTALPDAD